MLVGNHLKRLAGKMGKTIYQIQDELLSNYLINELKYPGATCSGRLSRDLNAPHSVRKAPTGGANWSLETGHRFP